MHTRVYIYINSLSLHRLNPYLHMQERSWHKPYKQIINSKRAYFNSKRAYSNSKRAYSNPVVLNLLSSVDPHLIITGTPLNHYWNLGAPIYSLLQCRDPSRSNFIDLYGKTIHKIMETSIHQTDAHFCSFVYVQFIILFIFVIIFQAVVDPLSRSHVLTDPQATRTTG